MNRPRQLGSIWSAFSTSLSLCVLLGLVPLVPTLHAQPAKQFYQEAIDAMHRGDPQQAVTVLNSVLAEDSGDLKARTLLGMALVAAGKRTEAVGEFERVLRANPRYAPALRNLAAVEMATADATHAKAHFEQMLQLNPQDPYAHLGLAEIELGAKHYQAAVQQYELSGNLYRQDPAALVSYARVCLELKDVAKASAALALLPSASDSNLHYAAGLLLARMDRFSDAAREFELARADYQNKYELGYNLLLAYLKSGQPSAAIQTGKDLIQAGLVKAELYNLLSQAYEAANQTADAYESLRTATRLEPTDEANYLDLIGLCITHKNYDLGLEIANVGVERMPLSARLQVQRGIVLAMKEDFTAAKRSFETARRLTPAASTPTVALALILMQMNHLDEATKMLRERANSANPDFLILWFFGEALNRGGATPGSADEKAAVSALEKSVSLNPQLAESRILLGKFLSRRGDMQRAKIMLEDALRLDPYNVTAMYQLAQVLTKTGDAARAKELFAKVSQAKTNDREQFNKSGLQQILREMKPNAAEAQFQEGLEFRRQARTEEAMRSFREAERLRPHYTEALYMLADSCRKLGDTSSELRLLKSVIDQAPNFAEARYNLGIALQAEGKLAEAVEQLRVAARLEPALMKWRLALGTALAEQNSPEAIAVLRSAVSLDKSSAQAHYDLALALANSGNEPQAILAFQAAIRLKVNFAQAQRGLGIALMHSGRMAEAVRTLQEALRLAPEDAETANNLGMAQMRNGNTNAAIDGLENAIRLNPRLIKAHSVLSQAYLKAGRAQDSRRAADRAAALTEEQRRLGRALVLLQSVDQRLRAGDLKTAEAQVREVIADSPNVADAHFRLGQILAQQGESDAAMRAFRKTLNLDPERAGAHFAIGRVLSEQGHTAEAAEEFQFALKMKPCDVEYLSAAGPHGKPGTN